MLWLALPAALALALLAAHSVLTLPARRALAFWSAVSLYALLRAWGVRLVTEHGLDTVRPYVLHGELPHVAGVSAVEIAGWAIVAYLGWWLAARVSRELVLQVVWASLFLGTVSWAVEATAVAASWWHWTIPASPRLLGVPFIAVVDWAFVAVDLLLPFLALSAPARPRWAPATVLLFPAHFVAHLWTGLHVVHWGLALVLFWAALRDRTPGHAWRRRDALPLAALSIVLGDLWLVDLAVLRRPELVLSTIPAAALVAISLAPGGVTTALRWARRPIPAAVLVLALGVTALGLSAHASRRQRELRAGLDRALAARDGGDVAGAEAQLRALAAGHPDEHVPHALLGEIQYRSGRLGEARRSWARAARIHPAFPPVWIHLAVIELRSGDAGAALVQARAGRRIHPGDPDLAYLELRARHLRGERTGPELARFVEGAAQLAPAQLEGLVALAYEVDDAATAAALLDAGLQRHPARADWRTLRDRIRGGER